MPSWVCAAKRTIFVPSGPEGHHLHVVLNDPKDFEGHSPQSCLSVSVCTIRKGPYDNTVVVLPDQNVHPFIKHPSYIAFRHTRIDRASHLEQLVGSMVFTPSQDIDEAFLETLREGIRNSPQTPRCFKELDLI